MHNYYVVLALNKNQTIINKEAHRKLLLTRNDYYSGAKLVQMIVRELLWDSGASINTLTI